MNQNNGRIPRIRANLIGTKIRGWAIGQNHDRQGTIVKIWIDSKYIASISTFLSRPDVRKRQKVRNAQCGFEYFIPEVYCDGNLHKINLTVDNSEVSAKGFPIQFQFPIPQIQNMPIESAFDIANNEQEQSFGLKTAMFQPIKLFNKNKYNQFLPENFSGLNIDKEKEYIFLSCSEENHWSSDGYIILPNALVIKNGAVLTQSGKILKESIEGPINMNFQYDVELNKYLYLNKDCFFDEPIFVLQRRGTFNYYHWTIEMLPKLYIYMKYFFEYNIKVCIFRKPNMPKFIMDSIQTYLQDRNIEFKNFYIVNSSIINSKYLIYPMFVKKNKVQTSRLMPSTIQFYTEWRDCIFQKYIKIKNSNFRRIFLSREDASQRKVINEKEFVDFLRQYDFQKVRLGKLSISEQISLFANADIIIGPHGANLTNIVFSRSQTIVIEIIPRQLIHRIRCYWDIANQFELRYFTFVVSEMDRQENFKINIKNFQKLLDRIL